MFLLNEQERAKIISDKIKALENQAIAEREFLCFNTECPLDGQNEGE